MGEALRAIFAKEAGGLSSFQQLALRRAAFQFAIEGKDSHSRLERQAYLGEMCRQYDFRGRPASAFELVHESCADDAFDPDELTGDCSCDMHILTNSMDPVVPLALQRQWRNIYPHAKWEEHSVLAHSDPGSPVLFEIISHNASQDQP